MLLVVSATWAHLVEYVNRGCRGVSSATRKRMRETLPTEERFMAAVAEAGASARRRRKG